MNKYARETRKILKNTYKKNSSIDKPKKQKPYKSLTTLNGDLNEHFLFDSKISCRFWFI